MLSASTINSASSSAFSSGPGLSTPSSQYSHDARKNNSNPLTELIDTEENYMETLKMIDSQIAPIWMKQMTSAAPDFSELLKYIHDILKVNKRFCMKLTKIAANPQAISELGDVLMQWVDDLEVPYANFSRSYIPKLNQRTDILQNPAMRDTLKNLSAKMAYDINLESLFNSPIQQLKYYKGLYNRLLESTDPGRADHKLLSGANKRIDMIMAMSQKSGPTPPPASNQSRFDSGRAQALPHIQTNFQTPVNPKYDLALFETQVDCSRTVDLFGGARINHQLRLNHPGAHLVMRDSFTLISSETGSSSMRVHIVMTNESLVICREIGSSQFILLYPAIPIKDIAVNAQSLDREIVGEYILLFSIQGGKKNIVVRADSKEVRNLWVGVDPEAPSTAALASRSLTSNPSLKNAPAAIAPPAPKPSKSSSSIRNTEIFDFYTEEISPIESDDDDLYYNTKGSNNNNNGGSKPRDTIMDIYDNQLHEFEEDMDDFPPIPVHKDANEELANITPQSIKILPQVPNLPNAQSSTDGGASQPPSQAQAPSKDNVKMTYIAPPTAQMAKLSTSPVMPTNQSASSMNSSPPSPQTPLSGRPLGPGMKNESKPSSPRAVEVQQAIIPEVMQAVTQTTDEYLKNQQSNGQNVLPRTSSMRNNPNKNAPTSPIVAQRPSAPPPAPQHQMGPPQGQFAPPNGGVNQFGNMRPMPPQQNFRPGPPPGSPQQPLNRMMSNNAPPRPMMNGPRPPMNPSLSSGRAGPPAPIMMAPSFSNGTNNGGMRRPPPGQPLSPRIQSNPHLQPGNPNDLNSPPLSPNQFANSIRQILFSNSQCDVFHWNNNTWYAAEGQCLLQVRVANSNRGCVSVQLQNTGQLYLNAWVLPTTVIRQPSPTDINISLFMGPKKENYLIHFNHPNDASVFLGIVKKVHQESIQQQQYQQQQQQQGVPIPITLMDKPEPEEDESDSLVNVPQTLKAVMQCKCKLFIKNETSSWGTLGSVTMRISQQTPSMRMHIQMENGKNKLVSAVVRSGNVERINSKRISFLLVNEAEKTSIVYMIHLREDQTGNKIYEYLRTKNAANGW